MIAPSPHLRRIPGRAGATAAFALALTLATPARAGAAPVRFDLTLQPQVVADSVATIAVSARYEAGGPVTRGLRLTAPIVYAGVFGIAERVEALTVRDAQGALPLAIEDDPAAPGGFPYFRHWRATRPVRGAVTYTYRARVQPAGGRNGPPFGMRACGGGVIGAGSGFLVLPEDTSTATSRVRWELGAFGREGRASTSLGDGDFTFTGPVAELLQAWYAAGPLQHYPATGDTAGFSAAWLGKAPFDAEREMAWSASAYQYFTREFRTLSPAPRYRVFMRFLELPPPGGGTALTQSFMLSRSATPTPADSTGPRETFAHEMIHQWVGQMDATLGVGSWYSEGLTTYYTLEMMRRGGLQTAAEYDSGFASLQRRYATNPGRRFSADSIAHLGFGDERIRHVPYERGALYFFDLAARIRTASQGRRTLDDVLRELWTRRERGEHVDRAEFLDAMAAELGDGVRAEFDARILRGEPFTLAPGAGDPHAPILRRDAVTAHEGTFGGVRMPYTARVSETLVADSTGSHLSAIVTTSYLRDGVADLSRRPVVFLFNGGPGASSTPLHFAGFGPMRRVGQGDAEHMMPNPDSPLDVADLVFVDPTGTGYSRPIGDAKPFCGRTADARSVKAVIGAWLDRHGRRRSPVYLCGESYGTTRVAAMLNEPGGPHVDGVLLFSLVGSARGEEMPWVVRVPAFAATAWYHQRVPRKGRSVEAVYREALAFARGEYVNALIQGSSLPPAERRRVATRLSALIGLPVPFIEAHDLRIDNEAFMFHLLLADSLRTGQLDGRATARLDAPKRRPPYDDPGLNYAPPSTEEAAPPSFAPPQVDEKTGRVATLPAPPAVEHYYRDTLGFPADDAYIPLNLDVNMAWDHEGFTNINGAIGAAMAHDPALRVFWTGGYFDLTTPLYGARYALDHAGVDAGRLTALMLAAGHTVFADPLNRTIVSNAFRAFVHPEPSR